MSIGPMINLTQITTHLEHSAVDLWGGTIGDVSLRARHYKRKVRRPEVTGCGPRRLEYVFFGNRCKNGAICYRRASRRFPWSACPTPPCVHRSVPCETCHYGRAALRYTTQMPSTQVRKTPPLRLPACYCRRRASAATNTGPTVHEQRRGVRCGRDYDEVC